ncbi:hypothetical protein PIB30_059082 [Stylosanthes scabra]|uniref:NB-ARC domain-containing protein n=1 Tax=Stylosanthes scabra TaxID=79078 RepID=A0ABU6TMC0_9FABA|nr:hypothetical protein [Stylosanthes scabra]
MSIFLQEEMKNPELQQILKAKDLLQKIVKNCYIERQNSPSFPAMKNVVRELVSKLTTNSGNLLTLSIVGMKGVGKKTLAVAEAIYYNKDVANHFPIHVWVAEGAASKLKVLQMKQDGTTDHLMLPITEELIPETGVTNGSRILLTTPLKNIASYVDTCGAPHQIRLLTREDSWTLFQKVTVTVKAEKNSQGEKLARKVVARCGGLPLVVVSIGFQLSVKHSLNENTCGHCLIKSTMAITKFHGCKLGRISNMN